MISKRYIYLTLVLSVLLAGNTLAQEVLQLAPFSESGVALSQQIQDDIDENGGIISGRIYELESGGIYQWTATIYVEAEESLHIHVDGDEKAIIYMVGTGAGDNPQNPVGNIIRSRGGDIHLEGLAIAGYNEGADDPDNENWDDGLYTVQGNMLRTDNEGANIYLNNNNFSNINGQILRTEAATGTIRLEDNVLSNLGALSTSNFGAGKGLDLRAASVDSLILINNTFVNYQDRPIRHYNFGDPEAGTGEITYALFDHNTFLNGMGFHGLLSLGTVGEKIVITNNLFVDAFAAGEDSTDATRTAEWGNIGEQYENGNNKMAWIFSNANDVTEWVISNNYFAVTAEGQGFFDEHEELGVGQPLSNHIISRIGEEAAAVAFTQIDDPEITDAPDLMLGLMDYYVNVANKTKDTPNDVWNPAIHDMDRRPIGYYVNTFDASYSESSEAYTGAIGGFPAGDLNWFPEAKAEWLNTSIDPQIGIPNNFALRQNYPNPFNPSTTISYDIATAANVQIEVYDVLGQKVATLINGDFHSTGSYSITFNASNLSSGIYFYTLKAGNVLQTRKMTLLK